MGPRLDTTLRFRSKAFQSPVRKGCTALGRKLRQVYESRMHKAAPASCYCPIMSLSKIYLPPFECSPKTASISRNLRQHRLQASAWQEYFELVMQFYVRFALCPTQHPDKG